MKKINPPKNLAMSATTIPDLLGETNKRVGLAGRDSAGRSGGAVSVNVLP